MPRALVLLLSLAALACTPPAYKKNRLMARPADPAADAGAHDEALHEWWYWTGHLEAEGGRRFGFELTFFRVKTPKEARALAVLPAWWLQDTVLIGHFALTDEQGKRFVQAEKSDAGARPRSKRGTAAKGKMEVTLDGWTGEQVGSIATHHLEAGGNGARIDLVLKAAKPVVRHGAKGDGIQAQGAAGISYYLSQTRMTATGTVTLDGEAFPVTGVSWHDHQWGSWKTRDVNGWDWYSAQLDDGTELMLYQVDPPMSAGLADGGSFVEADATLRDLGPTFTITPTGKWTSSAFGRAYPMGWKIEVPARGISLVMEPVLEDQEFDGRRSIGVVYWEGAVRVSGTREGKPVAGRGYVELTNYACAPNPVPPAKGPLPCPPPVRKLP